MCSKLKGQAEAKVVKHDQRGSHRMGASTEHVVTFDKLVCRDEAERALHALVPKDWGSEAAYGGYESLGPWGLEGRGRFGEATVCRICSGTPARHAHKEWVLWIASRL